MNQYDWKNYTNNRLELANLSSNQFSVVEVSYENLPDELVKLIKPFYLKYQTIQIPNFNKNLLTELLQLYSLDFTIEQFITIGCSLLEKTVKLTTTFQSKLTIDFGSN